MTKGSTKYQLLKDDFNHATEQLKLYRKEIECLKKAISNSKHENRRLKKENESILVNWLNVENIYYRLWSHTKTMTIYSV